MDHHLRIPTPKRSLSVIVVVIEKENNWEKALQQALELLGKQPTVLLVRKEAVKRCLRCDPELFKHLHQFILDGGKALLCAHCLDKMGIPPSRPPEIFIQIASGEAFIREQLEAGHQILYF